MSADKYLTQLRKEQRNLKRAVREDEEDDSDSVFFVDDSKQQ